MQCVSDLSKLQLAVRRRSAKLRALWLSRNGMSRPRRRIALAYGTIELDNLIVMGLRQFTKSSLLNCRTAGGARVSCTFSASDPRHAAAAILATLNRPKHRSLGRPLSIDERQEQIFREPRDALKVLTQFGATNAPSLIQGMAYNGTVFSEIGTVRNFFAHRASGTSERVKSLGSRIGLMQLVDAEALLESVRPGTSLRVFEGWLNDVDNFFGDALL
jgi:hypothetical protein